MASLHAHSARHLSVLFKRAREPVFLLGGRGEILYVNPAWEALTGLAAEAVLGRPACEAGASADVAAPSPFVPPAEALRGDPCGTRSLIVAPTGARLWRRIEFWPYRNAKSTVIGLLGLVRDDAEPPVAPDSESARAASELAEACEALRRRHGHASLVGNGPRHERLLAQVAAAARSRTPALIVGEPGTGRTQVARVIHERSDRPEAPFLAYDLAALGPETLEAEILARVDDELDRLVAPDGATLLLDDLGRLPRDLQARLAPALSGASARLLGATALDPETAVREGRWREDFYFAVSPLVLRLPPLRDRLDELPLLAQHFLEGVNRRSSERRASFAPDAAEALAAYDWPGNLAELARVVESAHARASGDRIVADDLPPEIRGELASAYAPSPAPAPITSLDGWLMQLERRMIESALVRARQNKSRAAELLEISRPRLYRRIKELNIPDEPDSGDEANGRHGMSADGA